MSKLKTVENDADVDEFLSSVENPKRRRDAMQVAEMMGRVTAEPARMWGDSIIGFGRYRYRRSDQSEHNWMLVGLSPRKTALTVYIMAGFSAYGDLLARLGKHKHSVSCLYISRLDNIDFDVLTELVRRSVDDMREKYSA
ncbi:MAG: DUF1801 domain-containing protein [Albidovulum sp.]|nr:DUF1801 domain-containing protein [Albidovulum sp.]MDE0307724.1 DUF1801 domain-containing protein [Albidovulum sp.]